MDPARTADRRICNGKAGGVTQDARAAATIAFETVECRRRRGILDNESANGRRDDRAPACKPHLPSRRAIARATRAQEEAEVLVRCCSYRAASSLDGPNRISGTRHSWAGRADSMTVELDFAQRNKLSLASLWPESVLAEAARHSCVALGARPLARGHRRDRRRSIASMIREINDLQSSIHPPVRNEGGAKKPQQLVN